MLKLLFIIYWYRGFDVIYIAIPNLTDKDSNKIISSNLSQYLKVIGLFKSSLKAKLQVKYT